MVLYVYMYVIKKIVFDLCCRVLIVEASILLNCRRLFDCSLHFNGITCVYFSFAGEKTGVKLHELMGSLSNTRSHSEVKKLLSNVQRNQKVVDTPLHKHQEDKVGL